MIGAVLAAITAAHAAGAGELQIGMDRGRVTLIATGVPLSDVLAEWSRVGQTRFEGAEPLAAVPVTLHLIDVPERDALHMLLRPAFGYLAASRPAGVPGASVYDRVKILAVRRASPPAAGGANRRSGSTVPRGPAAAEVAAPAPTESPANDPAPAAVLLRLERLQRLLDAAADPAASPSAGSEARPGTTGGLPLTVPFPGMLAEPPEPPEPARARRRRGWPPGVDPFRNERR